MDASSSSSMNEFDYIEQEYGNLKRQYRIMEGDRGAYQQKAQNHIARQDALIKRLRQEETDLTTNLKLAQSTAVSKKDNGAFSEIKNLSQAQQLYRMFERGICEKGKENFDFLDEKKKIFSKKNFDPNETRTRNLLTWNQTRYHCAIKPH